MTRTGKIKMNPNRMTSGLLFAAGLGVLTPVTAMAYIGPGAGLGAVAITLALAVGIILLAVGLIWYPLKRLIKKRNMKKGNKEAAPGSGSADGLE
jgi:hypothetical protein